MDTPNSKPSSTSTTTTNNKLINLHSSDSSAVQESPVFDFISNLSPIQPVKAAPVAQGFPGLASPPLVFRSPRNSLLSVFNRQLRSSAFTTEFSQDNDKSQKTHENPGGSANRDLGLQSQVSNNQKGCNTKKLGQVVHCSPSGCFDEFLPNPVKSSDPLHKKQSGDVPQSSEVVCLEKKDNGTDEDRVPDGSTLLKVRERAKAKSKISIKVVKNEPKRLISASSECPGILTKLPRGHTSELYQTGDSFSEASHFERSLRRCLFDENERENSADGSGFWNPNENLSRIQEVANMSSSETPGNSQMINLPKPITGMSVSPITGNHPVSISKPLGIGLHLNSVVYPRTKDSIIGGQQASEKVVRVEGNNSVFVVSNQQAGNVCESSVPTNLIDKFPATSEERNKSKLCSVATSSRTFASDAVELFNNPIVLKPDHPSATVYNKRKLNSELAESNEEFNQASPKKKRKKSSGTSDDDTVKRCNCKKSKCLKLYCDCFAAGFYCGESCSCKGCFNRPEFEDTVLETRQQIESRNPLAFAPKVVQPVTDSPASSKEVENLSTPSSARHKRGCNCKKSMCLKKYCECYQSNVGCSDNCRCEGCKNVYGIREDFSIAREFMIKVTEATPKVILDEKKEISTVRGNIVNSRVHNSPNVTPVTPALQCSDQRNNALKSRVPFSRCLQSPDSSHDILLSDENFTSPPISSSSHRLLDDEPLDPEKGCENSDRLLTPCERAANASDSVSTVASSSSKTRDLFHVSRPETFARSSLPPSSSHLRWRSSPVMPFTQSAGSEYLPNYDSGGKDSDVLGDDTPEILKDSATPTESVKVRSPNKKRISPPHNRVDSPESLRNSRKFVLQAVCSGLDHRNLPKFPPVSSFSQNSGNDKRNESKRNESLDP